MKETKKKTSRQLQAEDTRNQLFEVALELLRHKDFDQITIREIVAAAKVSIGTFYLYYTSKIEVYYQTYTIADRYFDEVVTPKLTQPSAKARILTFFENYADYNANIAGLRLCKLLFNTDNKNFARQRPTGIVPDLIELVRQGQQAGEFDNDVSAKTIANDFMIAVRGHIYHWCTQDGGYDLVQATVLYANKLLKMYATPERGAEK